MICVNEGLNGLYHGNERNDLQKGGICPNLGNIPEDMSSGKCHAFTINRTYSGDRTKW